ncbi:MAG TPA: PHB depolymerase family esterase [Anaerolineales bacterium]|nr:PHB depolymerase family esterase [Anaerolineales bacterium]
MKKFKSALFKLAIVIFVFGLAACSGKTSGSPQSAATVQPVDSQRSLTVDGLERTYLLHIPAGLDGSKPVPLVFVFHGLGESAGLIQQASGFDGIADKNGFIVVYPNGSGPSSGQSWNAGKCCGYALDNKVSEADFVRQIIADLGGLVKIDPARIYATGFSNGGLLSYRLGCEMADTLAAVAPVAGVLVFDPCQPAGPISLIDFHGMSDTTVPYAGGGVIPGLGEPFPPVGQSVATFASLDGCSGNPRTDQTNVFNHSVYGGCKSGSSVELYTINGIGHSWPSQYIVPASQMIWDFFKAHPKQ